MLMELPKRNMLGNRVIVLLISDEGNFYSYPESEENILYANALDGLNYFVSEVFGTDLCSGFIELDTITIIGAKHNSLRAFIIIKNKKLNQDEKENIQKRARILLERIYGLLKINQNPLIQLENIKRQLEGFTNEIKP